MAESTKDRWLILSMIVKEKEKLVVNFKEVISQPSSRCLALITGLIYDPSPGFLCLKELLWLHGDVKHTHTHTLTEPAARVSVDADPSCSG